MQHRDECSVAEPSGRRVIYYQQVTRIIGPGVNRKLREYRHFMRSLPACTVVDALPQFSVPHYAVAVRVTGRG